VLHGELVLRFSRSFRSAASCAWLCLQAGLTMRFAAALLVQGGDAVANQVQMWLARYEDDGLAAVAELATLLVQAAGSPYQVSRAQVENVDAEALTQELVTDDFKKIQHYPLEKEKSAYYENFCSFWNKLVMQAGDVVFDEFLMAHICAWVEMLSNWEVRSFRHVGTVTGNQLVTALIALRKKRVTQSETAVRGRRKSKSQQEQSEEEAGQLKALEELIDSLFNSVFVIRYRDVSPDIRCLCIKALGSWIPDYDSVMMDTKYVKYLGWALYDPKAPVRLAAVKVRVLLASAAPSTALSFIALNRLKLTSSRSSRC
jgi:cohesin complex subunit SA-1/2